MRAAGAPPSDAVGVRALRAPEMGVLASRWSISLEIPSRGAHRSARTIAVVGGARRGMGMRANGPSYQKFLHIKRAASADRTERRESALTWTTTTSPRESDDESSGVTSMYVGTLPPRYESKSVYTGGALMLPLPPRDELLEASCRVSATSMCRESAIS